MYDQCMSLYWYIHNIYINAPQKKKKKKHVGVIFQNFKKLPRHNYTSSDLFRSNIFYSDLGDGCGTGNCIEEAKLKKKYFNIFGVRFQFFYFLSPHFMQRSVWHLILLQLHMAVPASIFLPHPSHHAYTP